jgi:hypothetical protein
MYFQKWYLQVWVRARLHPCKLFSRGFAPKNIFLGLGEGMTRPWKYHARQKIQRFDFEFLETVFRQFFKILVPANFDLTS